MCQIQLDDSESGKSMMRSPYPRVVIIGVAAMVVFFFWHHKNQLFSNKQTEKYSETVSFTSDHRSQSTILKKLTQKNIGIDDLVPDAYRNIPKEIYTCMNHTTQKYEYNFDTDLYLLPRKEEMCAMTTQDLEKLYQMYLSTVQTICKRPIRLGYRNDGGWDLCVEKQFLTPGKCQVYSFGINYDFSFDDAVAKDFDCEVHSFDPSMNQKSYQRSTKPFVYFHDIGIASKSSKVMGNKEWTMLTLKDTMTELGHKTIPDVIKMDIEYWEWDVLPDVLTSSQLPKQLAIEYHLWSADFSSQKILWLHRLWILKDIYDAGYRSFWLNRNLPCTFKSKATSDFIYACHEVSYVKTENDVRLKSK